MKRIIIILYFLLFGLSIGFAQDFADDLYITPTKAKAIQNAYWGKKEEVQKKKRAKKIVFIDQHGNPTNNVTDTLYIIDSNTYSGEITTINDSTVHPNTDRENH